MAASPSLVSSRQVAAPFTGASPDYTPSLGTNLEGLSYYSTALPLIDLMNAFSEFFAESATTFNTGTGINAGADDLHAGEVVTLTTNLSQAVTVSGGTPTLVLNDGGVATYSGGSGSTALTFSYTVATGQNTADLAVTSMQRNGETVGTGAPTITADSGQSLTDANGHVFSFGGVYSGSNYFILRDGQTFGTGATLARINGMVWAKASGIWFSNNGSNWVYQPSAPSLGGGAAADLSGVVNNPAGMLQIDNTIAAGPTVTSLVAIGSGTTAGADVLHAGAVVTLIANLSQAAVVSGGKPTLVLNDGGAATYTGGSGSTALSFSYAAKAGQNTADLAVSSVQLNAAFVGTGVPAITAGSGQSLTDANGHVFSFGGVYNGSDHYILGEAIIDGAETLTLVNGTVWDSYSNNGSTWVYQPTAPSLSGGTVGDLSGAVTNLRGVPQIDIQTIGGETLQGSNIANATLNNSGLIHVMGSAVSALNNVSINDVAAASASFTIDSGSTLSLTNSTINGGTHAVGGTHVLNSVGITNSGTIEASSSTLTIASGALTNNGSLLADSGKLIIFEAVTGNGGATIKGTNSSNQNTTFANGAVDTLKLDDASHYTGTIAGLVSGDAVNLSLPPVGTALFS